MPKEFDDHDYQSESGKNEMKSVVGMFYSLGVFGSRLL